MPGPAFGSESKKAVLFAKTRRDRLADKGLEGVRPTFWYWRSRCPRLAAIRHPALVVNGVHDEMIPVSNSYRLSENLGNAVLLTYPDAGHGSLFQYPESLVRQATAFLSSDSRVGRLLSGGTTGTDLA